MIAHPPTCGGVIADPAVLVLRHARVLSPEGAAERDVPVSADDAWPASLTDALTQTWPSDAHLVGYAPVEITTAGGSTITPRLTRGAVGDPAVGVIRMVAMVGDVDPPGHVATPEWRADVEPRLDATGHCWYRTRNGARLVTVLPEPYEIRTPADERIWTNKLLGWREYLLAEHGLEIDGRCSDWTRLYRLPNVRRGGREERAPLSRAPRAWDPRHWVEPSSAARPSAQPTPSATTATPAVDRAIAVAERLPSSVEGMGGDAALLHAAHEIASHLGEDADAIEAVLGVFSTRCLPPWPQSKLAYEARRAAAAQATPEARYARRLAERCDAARATPEITGGETPDPWHAEWDWGAPEEPVPYVIEGLRLAASRGKISLIAGAPGAAKGPLVDHIATCLALGLPVLGDMPVERTRVILVDCEGWALSSRRIKRMTRAMGIDPRELQGWLMPVDASTLGDMSALSNLLALEHAVQQHGAGVVVLDSYTTATLASGVDANSPQFAQLAQLLGRLGVLVLAVAHSRKIDGDEEPQLVDVAYSGALAALAQTAIVTSRPDAHDEGRIRIACARAPETRFAPLEARFADEPNGGLSVTRIVRECTAPAKHSRVTREAGHVGTVADEIERMLREVDDHGAGMTALKIRRHLAIPQKDWSAALIELRRRGTVTEGSSPASPGVLMRWKGV